MFIGFHSTLFKVFAVGPQSDMITSTHDACQKTWYTNLLYVNNLWLIDVDGDVDLNDCMGHTWYLANSMQFFIISPLLIWTLWKHEKIGLILSGILSRAATVVPFTLAWVEDFPFSPSVRSL